MRPILTPLVVGYELIANETEQIGIDCTACMSFERLSFGRRYSQIIPTNRVPRKLVNTRPAWSKLRKAHRGSGLARPSCCVEVHQGGMSRPGRLERANICTGQGSRSKSRTCQRAGTHDFIGHQTVPNVFTLDSRRRRSPHWPTHSGSPRPRLISRINGALGDQMCPREQQLPRDRAMLPGLWQNERPWNLRSAVPPSVPSDVLRRFSTRRAAFSTKGRRRRRSTDPTRAHLDHLPPGTAVGCHLNSIHTQAAAVMPHLL